MKSFVYFSFLLLSSAGLSAQEPGDLFKKLLSLKGTWSMESRKGVLYESWWQVNDSSLAGRSYRLINDIDTLLVEEMQISRKGADIFFIPVVQNQNNRQPIIFKLIKPASDTFSFDNPAHDYPQRVIYELPKNDNMHARIEGMDMGIYKKSDFYYKKVK